jgi:ADP-heptose:LPS heptosyltransferase
MSSLLTDKKTLVIRFSALGDVAMLVPVVKEFLNHYPDEEIVVLSNKQYADLFTGIGRLEFVGADLGDKHKGIIGIIRLFNLLRKQYQILSVADVHGVLRSHLLRLLFKLARKKTAIIDKGRFEKFALTRKGSKIFRPLPHTTERYQQVFAELGFDRAIVKHTEAALVSSSKKTSAGNINIGFAPFAKHDAKMYPLDLFKTVVSHFDKEGYQLYFFSGGGAEKRIVSEWINYFKHVAPIQKGLSIGQELEIMSKIDVMVTMDSANMHLASLCNVPVVSVWGATHPFAGFYGYNQNLSNAIQVNLPCRPCSVFGNKSCWRGDHACMNQITPQMIIDKIESILL